MSEGAVVQLTRTAAWEHEASRAWARLGRSGAVPSRVTVLRDGRKTGAYRLHGAGTGGSAVIAKRCRRSTVQAERLVYERVLPDGAAGTLRSFGVLEDGDAAWIFLEDAGGGRFSTSNREHRLLAARWLALLPLSIRGESAARMLPDASPARYLAQLREARETIGRGLANPVLRPRDGDLLRSLIALLDRLESRWRDLVEWCEPLAPTLVHGDMQPKNLRVRGRERELLVFDWETAGWGTPAADLALLRAATSDDAEVEAYRTAAREGGREYDRHQLRRVVDAGIIFRRIAAIDWDVAGLTTSWPQRAIACMRLYHAAFDEAMRGGPWAR